MIKKILNKTFSAINKNKSKVLFIFFLQILFFLSLSIIAYNTMIPSMQQAKTAVDYYDQIKLNESSGMFGYLGEEPLIVYQSYRNMMYYLRFLAIYAFLAFIIVNSLTWAVTDSMINKKNLKQYAGYLFNFFLLTSIFSLIVYVLLFNTLKLSLVEKENALLSLIGVGIVLIALIHFLLVGFSLIGKRKLKEIAKLTFKIGILKSPYLIQVCLINIVIISALAYLIYLTIELNLIILSIAALLFVGSFVFARLFLITAVNELAKKN